MLNENISKEERRRLKHLKRLEKQKQEVPIEVPIEVPNLGTPLTVLCVKFGDRYGKEYVERLRNMVSRHLTVPYEFVCLTDDKQKIEGVRSILRTRPNYKKLWWTKVHMFDPSLEISGRVLYFDLDIVIHSNIDKLVNNVSNDFYGIRDFNRKFYPTWKLLNSSAMTWIHGTQSEIYQRFINNVNEAQRLQGDQDWIWKVAGNKIKFWPDEWCQSYKWEIRDRSELSFERGRRYFKDVIEYPRIHKECCVAVFHGDPKPQDVKDKFVVDNWQ